LAWLFYVVKPSMADSMARSFSGPYRWLYNKYFVDEAYAAMLVEPVVQGSSSVMWRGFDVRLIDGIVNGIGRVSRGAGGFLKLWQSGNIRSYAAWVVLGSIFIIVAMTVGGIR
jgi:NADH-quinone oxidoreductase subunit L